MVKSKIIIVTLMFGFVFFLFSCDDPSPAKQKSSPNVISGKISQPDMQVNSSEENKKDELTAKGNQTPAIENDPQTVKKETDKEKDEHYNSQGKIDPFKPLIQETVEESTPVVDDRPKRILTPLEKIELSQIRLVAVIIMKGKQIAMVEEASGKGYEVGIGTYIGKNQGRVSEIQNSSIMIKELVRDYKGRLKEHVQEIKLHKNDDEE